MTAARGRAPERTVSGAILDGLATWVAAHLDGDPGPAHHRAAAALLATLEGAQPLDAVGRRALAEAAVGF